MRENSIQTTKLYLKKIVRRFLIDRAMPAQELRKKVIQLPEDLKLVDNRDEHARYHLSISSLGVNGHYDVSVLSGRR